MQHIWVLQYRSHVLGVYSGFGYADLARQDYALGNKMDPADEALRISAHRIDDNVEALLNARAENA